MRDRLLGAAQPRAGLRPPLDAALQDRADHQSGDAEDSYWYFRCLALPQITKKGSTAFGRQRVAPHVSTQAEQPQTQPTALEPCLASEQHPLFKKKVIAN